MCGIFFSLSRHTHECPDHGTQTLLENRGPDSTGTHRSIIDTPNGARQYATFISTVLSLRGTSVVKQPLHDASSGSLLCWNGEAWSTGGTPVEGNDSKQIFDALLQACQDITPENRSDSVKAVVNVLSSIRGPYALVFYDAPRDYLYYGRDCLGRRSLLHSTANGAFMLASVADGNQFPGSENSWAEVEADGLYVIDLSAGNTSAVRIPHYRKDASDAPDLYFPVPFPNINRKIPSEDLGPAVEQLEALQSTLRKSLQFRVQHVREAVDVSDSVSPSDARVAILFSGGLDCTILARLCHELLPVSEPIDLLNVAFENPRIHKNLEEGISPYELCPDRATGRSSHAELVKVCPGRQWRLVEINVPYSQTQAHRGRLLKIIRPHNTEMDLSIAYALYFASRGAGVVTDGSGISTPYTTPAHVLLSGLGADELFGGYGRHAVAYARGGYASLIDELALDFDRLGKRNLGRDDRVISDSGREVRFPYLDEDFIALALDLPVWAKCDFANEQDIESDDPARLLEPGKRALRMLAWELGMKGVAAEKKRAIQFGARTAKMETGRTKGTHVVS